MRRYFEFIAATIAYDAGNDIEFKYIVSFDLDETNTEEQNLEIIKNNCIIFWKNIIFNTYFKNYYFTSFYIKEMKLVSLENTELKVFRSIKNYSDLYDNNELRHKIVPNIEN